MKLMDKWKTDFQEKYGREKISFLNNDNKTNIQFSSNSKTQAKDRYVDQ